MRDVRAGWDRRIGDGHDCCAVDRRSSGHVRHVETASRAGFGVVRRGVEVADRYDRRDINATSGTDICAVCSHVEVTNRIEACRRAATRRAFSSIVRGGIEVALLTVHICSASACRGYKVRSTSASTRDGSRTAGARCRDNIRIDAHENARTRSRILVHGHHRSLDTGSDSCVSGKQTKALPRAVLIREISVIGVLAVAIPPVRVQQAVGHRPAAPRVTWHRRVLSWTRGSAWRRLQIGPSGVDVLAELDARSGDVLASRNR